MCELMNDDGSYHLWWGTRWQHRTSHAFLAKTALRAGMPPGCFCHVLYGTSSMCLLVSILQVQFPYTHRDVLLRCVIEQRCAACPSAGMQCVVLLHGPAGHPLGVWDLYSRNVNEYLLEVP